MNSRRSSKILDLDRDLPTSPADVLALRNARKEDRPSLKTYLELLAGFPGPSLNVLRARKGPVGIKPFDL